MESLNAPTDKNVVLRSYWEEMRGMATLDVLGEICSDIVER